MFSKLNGWYRIGIVLSALWVLYAAAYITLNISGHQSVFVDTIDGQAGHCIDGAPKIDDAPKIETPRDKVFSLDELRMELGGCSEKFYVEGTPDKYSVKYDMALLFMLTPLFVGWLVIIIIETIRWIVAGFRRKST